VIQKINFSKHNYNRRQSSGVSCRSAQALSPKGLRTLPLCTKIYIASSKLKCYSTRDVYLFIEFYFTPLVLNSLLHLVGTNLFL